jgi:hypothetical protein
MGIDIAGLGSIADFAKGVIDKIWPAQADPNAKLQAQAELQKMLNEYENTIVTAKAEVMMAEMKQDDKYTKRARPTIIYGGLFFIFLNHVIFPMIAWVISLEATATITLPHLNLPEAFWYAWAGVCGLYVIGRTNEKNDCSGFLSGLVGGKK